MIVPLAAVAAVVLVAGVTAARRPALRRLAVRSVTRRPGETVLIIVGSLLGTAIITGSFIVGDTLDRSIRSGAFTRLGPIDETVTAVGDAGTAALAERLEPLRGSPVVDGLTYAVRANGTAAARLGTPQAAAKPNVLLVELDFDDARDFGGDREAAGLGDVATPARGEAVLSEDLAEALEAGPGDDVTVFAFGGEHERTVSAVVPRRGLAGYQTFGARSFTAFLSPGTLERWAADAPASLEAAPPVSLAFVSNAGGVLDGAERTGEAMALIEPAIEGIPGAQAEPTKRDLLEDADRAGNSFSQLFLSIGSFAVIAGVLLLVNIFVMLAEERRSELGIMRAVGMRRGQLVRAFVMEGTVYAVASALLGAVAGIGVGAAIVAVASGIFQNLGGGFSLDLTFHADISSIGTGLLIGLFIALATIVATSVRIARVNIIRAIREIPEPAVRTPRLRTLVISAIVLLAGAAITAVSIAGSAPAGVLAGPAIAALGLAGLGGRVMARRPLVTALGVAVIGWSIAAFSLLPAVFRGSDETVFVVLGMIITFAAVAVISFNQEAAGGLVRRIGRGRRGLAARVGLAYPLARRFRTGMSLTMFALVVFTLVFISIVSNTFGAQVDRFVADEAGGYDLIVRTSPGNPVAASAVEEVDGVATAASIRHAIFTVEFRTEDGEYEPWAVSGFDGAFVDGGPPALAEYADRYETEEEVWRAVAADPRLLIVDSFFLQRGGGPPERNAAIGDRVLMRDRATGEEAERVVVGELKGGLSISGAYASKESVEQVLGNRAPPRRLYVTLEPGASADAVAAALQATFVPNGVEAESFRRIVQEAQQVNLQFFRLMQGYLALGLLVGISGLGVIMVRAVRERRREIGMLRSLGFQPEGVRRAFLFESGFVALEGIVVGGALSVLTAYQLFTNSDAFGDAQTALVIPWGEIAFLLALTLAGALLATAVPAARASRIRPAVALRIAD